MTKSIEKQMTEIRKLREQITQLTNAEQIAAVAKQIAACAPNYRPMVQVGNEWAGNALVFATREEAEANVRQLAWNWTSVKDTRVDETDMPVNYRFIDGKLEAINHD